MYTCPDCGSEMKFDPSRQKLYCEFCGRMLEVEEVQEKKAAGAQVDISPEQAMEVHQAAESDESEITPARQRYEAYLAKKEAQPHKEDSTGTKPYRTGKAEGKETGKAKTRPTYEACTFRCPNCGAELISTKETVATFCSYCGSSVLLESRVTQEACPDYVIPFRVTKEACEKAYGKTLRKALFVPDEMKQDTQIQRFRGIYMPYWMYSFEQDGLYRVAGKKSRRRGDYVYTRHYRLESYLKASCKGISYDASSTFADYLSSAIAPFDTHEQTAFTPGYLSGFYADRGDVSAGIYQPEAEKVAGEYVANQAEKNPLYQKYHVGHDGMVKGFRPKKSDAELGMFPVWFLGCRSHDGKRISYAVVNGQTGKVAADLPIDLKKYLLGSVILAVPLFFLLNAFLTLTPAKALMGSIGLALVSFFLSNQQMNRIYTRDLQLDDMGLWSVTRSKNRRAKPTTTEQKSVWNLFLRILGLMAFMMISMIVAGALIAVGPFRTGSGVTIILLAWMGVNIYAWISILRNPLKTNRKSYIYPAPMKEKWGTLRKPLLSIVIALGILIWNPVSDLYYYIGAALSLGGVVWTFFDIIEEHNLLTTRKLPQLEKRGGDENA